MNKNKKILVCDGGGAFLGSSFGFLYAKQKKYDVCIGTSAGSLASIIAYTQEYEKSKNIILNIDSDFLPVNLKKLNVASKIMPKLFFANKYKNMSVSEFPHLEKLIREIYTLKIHKKAVDSDRELFVVVCCITKNKQTPVTHYISNKCYDYETFVKYAVASCSIPFLVPPIEIDGHLYVDGGVSEAMPLKFALQRYENSNIDIFTHNLKHDDGERTHIDSFVQLCSRVGIILKEEANKEELGDLSNPKNPLRCLADKFNNNMILYYMPEKYGSSIDFSKDQMLKNFNSSFRFYFKK